MRFYTLERNSPGCFKQLLLISMALARQSFGILLIYEEDKSHVKINFISCSHGIRETQRRLDKLFHVSNVLQCSNECSFARVRSCDSLLISLQIAKQVIDPLILLLQPAGIYARVECGSRTQLRTHATTLYEVETRRFVIFILIATCSSLDR